MKEDNPKSMDMQLLKEQCWNIEDKLNILQEGAADQEAEIIRLTRMNSLLLKRIVRLETSLIASKQKDQC